MLEKEIEMCLIKTIKELNGLCIKFSPISFVGMPDRIVILPNAKIGFIELKAPNKKPRAIQVKRIKQLQELGFKAFVVDNKNQIDEVIKIIKEGGDNFGI